MTDNVRREARKKARGLKIWQKATQALITRCGVVKAARSGNLLISNQMSRKNGQPEMTIRWRDCVVFRQNGNSIITFHDTPAEWLSALDCMAEGATVSANFSIS